MRYLTVMILMIFSFMAFSKEGLKNGKDKEKTKILATESKDKKAVKAEPPCESKEDLLKRISEKQKAEAQKARGFSLQGGDTGCSIK